MIKPEEFKKRRNQISQRIEPNSIAILIAKNACIRNGDADYKYRPDSNFYYLTGCDEPHSLLVISPCSENKTDILFCKKSNQKYITWHGPMMGLQAAKDRLLFDESYDIDKADEIIPQLMLGCEKVYFMLGEDNEFDAKIVQWTNKVKKEKWSKSQAPHELVSIKPYLDDMRVYKSKNEIRCMQKSADIAAKAHINMMQSCQPDLYEYNLNAAYMYTLLNENSHPSYLPIIGGGKNACYLHYINNNEKLVDGDLVLVDAGAECDYYASDITRTFPVNGVFSEAQKEVYSIVLKAQEAAIAAVKPGNHWNQPHEEAVKVIAQGLLDLGLLSGSLDDIISNHTYAHFYMHKTGHWIGLDVHDCGDYSIDGMWVELEENMVLTIEPGIYISEDAQVPSQYKGMGIRIEDDVLVTKTGHKVLSYKAPKTIMEIEKIMRKNA